MNSCEFSIINYRQQNDERIKNTKDTPYFNNNNNNHDIFSIFRTGYSIIIIQSAFRTSVLFFYIYTCSNIV